MLISNLIGIESFCIIIVCIISGLRLVLSPEVRHSTYQRYRTTCYYLAVACACLAIGNAVLLAKFGMGHIESAVCSIISTTISASQSLLFTVALIVLYTNQRVRYAKILLQMIPIVGFILLYVIATRFQSDTPYYSVSELLSDIPNNLPATIRFFYTLTYIIQCGFFTQGFLKVRKEYLTQVEHAATDNTAEIRMEWVKVAFFAALAEGILAFSTILMFPSFVSDFIFKTATILFYVFFPIYYINYSKTYNKVKALLDESPAVYEIEESDKEATTKQGSDKEENNKEENDGMEALVLKLAERNNQLFQKAQSYMADTCQFLHNEMKAEDLVSALGTNRTYLANAIKQNRQCTITDYITSFRLEYAKSVLLKKELKMEEVALASGFNSVRTFNRNFKETYGITPEEFRNTTSA